MREGHKDDDDVDFHEFFVLLFFFENAKKYIDEWKKDHNPNITEEAILI